MRVATLFCMLVMSFTVWAAPVPRRVILKKPTTPGIAHTDLYKVNTLHWGNRTRNIGFQKDGYYWCSDIDPDTNRGIVWSGPYRFDGKTIIIEESCSSVSPDNPPTPSDPSEIRLELKREDGKIVGQGWGRKLKLE